MSQTALPISDDFSYGWSPVPIFSRIDEVIPLDDKGVANDPSVIACFQVKLQPLQPPCSGSLHQVLLRLQRLTGTDESISVSLLNGDGSQIAMRVYAASSIGSIVNYLSPPFILSRIII